MPVEPPSRNIPRPRGHWLLGQARDLQRDLLGTLVRLHREHGDVFHVRALHRRFVALAGPDANAFVAKHEAECMTTRPHYLWFARELGSDQFILTLSGEPHRRMRRLLRPGYSRDHVVTRIPKLIELAGDTLDTWRPGARLDLMRDLRRMVVDQLGFALGRRAAGAMVDDLTTMVGTLLRVTVARSHPRLALWSPSYRRARARVFDLVRDAVDGHRRALDRGEDLPRDHLDDLLLARDESGAPLDSDLLLASSLGPFVAGLDTVANTLALVLYGLHRHEDVLERVRAEVDEVCARGPLDEGALKDMPLLHASVLESLRMYPVTPIIVRTTTHDVEFKGARLPAGTDLMVAHCVPHYMDEFFPEPHRFDPERFLPPRNEHRKHANIYVPFAVGPHTCLGAGIADVMLMLDVALILRRFELRLDPPDYRLRVVSDPVSRAVGLGMRVSGLRDAPRRAACAE